MVQVAGRREKRDKVVNLQTRARSVLLDNLEIEETMEVVLV